MRKLITMELYKLFHSWGMLAFLVFYLLLILVLAPFHTAAEFQKSWDYDNAAFMQDANEGNGIAVSSLQKYLDWYPNYVFPKALSDRSAVSFTLVLIFPAFFFCSDFASRTYNGPQYAGRSRSSVFFAKAVLYDLLTFVLSVGSVLIVLFHFAPAFYQVFSLHYIVVRLLLRGLTDVALANFPMVLAFLFHDMLRTVATTFAVMILMNLLERFVGVGAAMPTVPADFWSGTTALPVSTIVVSLLWIAISTTVGCVCFRHAELL